MLQREGFVVANMSASASAHSLLHRSSWKAEAIRRGDLKISGPIPITEDTPLSDEEEKKYAQNAARNEVIHPPDTPLQEQRQRSVSPPRPLNSPPAVPDHPMPLRSNLVAEQSQQHEETQEHPPLRSPLNLQPVTIIQQRDSVVPQSALNSPTPFRSTPESAAAKNVQKKRKSGLRNVFRKMFGKKSPEPEHRQEEETTRRGHSYHHSDPGLLRSTPPIEPQKSPSPAGPRISDLPVKELEPLHPLGQHLPYPMNVNAPPASPPDEYLTFDVNRPDLGRRRATLPTIPSAVAHRHSLDDSRPNMATWDERLEEDEMSPSGIGIAVSSPFQATSKPDRRRSRSADALHDIAKEFASTERRRSAEIKYWRQSHMSGSVYSRPETAKSAEPETIRSVQTQEPTFQEPEVGSFNEMSATLVQADDPQTPTSPEAERPKDLEEAVEHAPVSDFNFGDLDNAALVGPPPAEREPVHEPAKEISPEQPLPSSSEKRLSIEERVLRLESRYSNLETLTHRLSSRNNRQTIILENAPRSLRSRDRSTSVSASRSHSRSAPSIHQEPRRQSSSGPVVDEPVPVTSSPTSTAPVLTGLGNTEQAKALQDLHAELELERNARIALEHRVQTLQDDLSSLHALVNKVIASGATTSPSYPTPSPDMLILSSSEDNQRMSCSTPRANSRNPDTAFYSHGMQQHGWRNDSESVYSEDLAQRSSTEGVASPDEWITPKEEGFSGSGFFRHGEERGVRTYA